MLSLVLAIAVHLVTLSLFVAAFLVARGSGYTVPGLAVAAFLSTIGLTLRPRLGRVPRERKPLTRERAPGLHHVLDRIGDAMGARADLVYLSPDFNASWGHIGLRRKRMLTIGAPMWVALEPEQRVAVLAHE
ncbi:MAG TPA: M48 family metallopeptidase, partial [Acidimicrobiales bacterium]|nr:M48 family metallopeptidase [Acidimicrobiales bacterium]